MGFETSRHLAKNEVSHGLKIPYGIWNYPFQQNEKPLSLGLKIPYGIWNFWLRVVRYPLKSLKIPYGIWNFRQ